ncbi:hypothetical protein FH972_022295 [Carpinus fangiana]|uniref:Rhodopsin domain-containing protein n=1 Tax=Carpinus fangiana TaxID=176857 RepID=A0A5N6KRU7_9ROSI|nr:hypothetical protein FH972_022295 [Carpinus fangiana]
MQATDSHDSLGPTINGVQWAVVSLAVITCLCRLYIRTIRKHNAGLDDIAIVVATCLSIFGGITGSIFTHYGIGTHIGQLDSDQVMHATEWLLIGVFQSYLALFFVRLSIAIFIVRMLARSQKRLKAAVYACLFLNFANTLMICILLGTWCRPLEGVWNKNVPAKCLPNEVVTNGNRAFAAISAGTDILYAALPIAVFWRLQMNWKLKRNLVIIMLFTLVICACAIGKAATVNETTSDPTYVNGQSTFWAVLEVNLGIIVASLPALRQFCIVTREDITSLRSKSSTTNDTPSEYDGAGSDENSSRGSLPTTWRPSMDQANDTEMKNNIISVKHDISIQKSYHPGGEPPVNPW